MCLCIEGVSSMSLLRGGFVLNREKTVKKVFGKLLEGGSVICSARHFISSSLNALLLPFAEVIVPENPCSD